MPSHREPVSLSSTSSTNLFWTPAQMVAHQTSNGCNIRPGDLFGSGTVTGEEPDGFGTLLDAFGPHRKELELNGLRRTFLEDGDCITLTAHAIRPGYASIGFGACIGHIVPALDLAPHRKTS